MTNYELTQALIKLRKKVCCIGSTYTDEQAQDAIGSMVSSEFTYTDATPLLAINQINWSKITSTPTTISGYGITNGLVTLNGLTGQTQTFATPGTTGTDVNWSSAGTAHTLNIPDASATARGLINNSSQTIGGAKTFNTQIQPVAGLRTNATVQNANLNVPSGNGAGTQTDASYVFEGATTVAYKVGIRGGNNDALSTGLSFGNVIIGSTAVTEATSGTHALMANLVLKPIAVTNAAGATTNAATLYVEGVTTGITPSNGNYAIWSKSGQNRFDGPVSVGVSTVNVVSAALQIDSTTQGFLPPRMTATQASALTPAEGLLIYVTNTNGTFATKGWYGYNGATWQQL